MKKETAQVFMWDFFGPAATPTARHFLKHLLDTLAANNCSTARYGLFFEQQLHTAAFVALATCSPNNPALDDESAGCLEMIKGLKPRRVCGEEEFLAAIPEECFIKLDF